MKIVSAAEMREIDRATSERYGVPSLTLMENAGSAVATFVLSDYPNAHRITVICGKGNNGGDGFVAARKLAEAGRAVRILLLCDPQELRGDPAAMFERLSISPRTVREVGDLERAEDEDTFSADLIVDAILGTGFRPPVSGLYAAAIQKINGGEAPVVAVDIPSGADADATHPASDLMVRADAVVTFTAPRPAHVFAGITNGPTAICPIGSPAEVIISDLGLNLSSPADFAAPLSPRPRESNKGSYGHVLVIGGSVGKAGAAAMAGFAALRAGAGLATVATARSVLSTVAGFHPELMTEPLEETGEGTISPQAFKRGQLDAVAEKKTVLAIGPGISRNPETVEFVRSVVQRYNTTMVIDADGLNAFEGAVEMLSGRAHQLVITPHPGEMSRLTGLRIADIQANRIDVARKFAREHRVILVLKGHRTLIASADGMLWVNATGNPGMATGGTGDVLTGMIAGMIAQYPDRVLEATALAVYLHGLAGDLASDELAENSVVATDLIRYLPKAIVHAQKQRGPEFQIHA